MPNASPRSMIHAAADQASADAAGFLDTTSIVYHRRLKANGDPAGTKYAASPATRNIFTTHLVSLHTAEARVTKPKSFTSPFTRRRGPRTPLPVLRDTTTGATPADAYNIPFLIATFNDPILAPFNAYIQSCAEKYIQKQNDAVYRDWFLENRVHVLVPRTDAAHLPLTRITTANSAVLGQWTVPIHAKDELEAYVAGSRGKLVTGDEEADEDDEEECGMLVADLVAYGDTQPCLEPLDK